MHDLATAHGWKPPPSLAKVTLIVGSVFAALATLAAFGCLTASVAIGEALVFGFFGVDCYRRGDR